MKPTNNNLWKNEDSTGVTGDRLSNQCKQNTIIDSFMGRCLVAQTATNHLTLNTT